MEYRPLGDSGVSISVVGFGAWAAGGPGRGFGIGPQDDGDTVAAIRRAVEGGVNWIDTARAYGRGHSEEVVGQALRTLPPADRPMVFTKCSLGWNAAGELDPLTTPEAIRPQLDESLRRLGLERVDMLQIHWPHHYGDRLDEAWGVLLDLKREGKIRLAGVSNCNVDQLAACALVGHVDSLQPPLNAANRASLDAVIPWCRDRGTGVIVYSPMRSGLLSGAYSADRVAALPDDDVRKRIPDFQPPRLQQILAVADALAGVARRHGVTTAAAAVAWTLHWPGVTGAIVGARRPAHVEGWLPAADLTLTPDDLALVDRSLRTG